MDSVQDWFELQALNQRADGLRDENEVLRERIKTLEKDLDNHKRWLDNCSNPELFGWG